MLDDQLPYTVGALLGSLISHLFSYLSEKKEVERLKAQLEEIKRENEDLEDELSRVREQYNRLVVEK